MPGLDVTVLIPTRDRVASLLATLAGVWRQRDVRLDVVIVDDGSRPDVARQYARLGSERVRVLRNATSRGPAAARNAGIAIARGRWVAFLDDDDLWAPTKLRCQLDAAERAGAAWVWCGAVYLSGEGSVLSVASAPTPEDVRRQLPSGSVIPAGASNVIASTALLRQLGGFDESIFHMPDWDLWLRLLFADGSTRACSAAAGPWSWTVTWRSSTASSASTAFDRPPRPSAAACSSGWQRRTWPRVSGDPRPAPTREAACGIDERTISP